MERSASVSLVRREGPDALNARAVARELGGSTQPIFRLFSGRMERRLAMVASLRDYTVQVRDLYQTRLDVKQNRIMTILTIVTTVFMPLTLIVGWYGMNFRYMPELDSPYAYPIVIIVSLAIVILSLVFFHKKKWL